MPYGRRYWRRYYRRYYRGRYSNSIGKTRISKVVKASAGNMTQGGTFTVSAHADLTFTVPQGQSTGFNTLDIPAMISGCSMHNALSNVFDQYKVEKMLIKLRPAGDSVNGLSAPSLLFSVVDRSGFADTVTLATLRTYGSYKETQISGAKDVSPVHYISIGQSNLVEFGTYSDTKKMVQFPYVYAGVHFASSVAQQIIVAVSCEIEAQVRYRGVRLDTSAEQFVAATYLSTNDNLSVTDTDVLVPKSQYTIMTADGNVAINYTHCIAIVRATENGMTIGFANNNNNSYAAINFALKAGDIYYTFEVGSITYMKLVNEFGYIIGTLGLNLISNDTELTYFNGQKGWAAFPWLPKIQ